MKLTIKDIMLTVFAALFVWQILTHPKPRVEIETKVEYRDSVVRDTVTITKFKEKKVYEKIIRTDTIYTENSVGDTVYFPVPIRGYLFTDSLYSIKAEGYNIKLSEVKVFPQTIYRYKKETQTITRRPVISHGLNVGLGALYGTKGLDFGFYGGYGITINF